MYLLYCIDRKQHSLPPVKSEACCHLKDEVEKQNETNIRASFSYELLQLMFAFTLFKK